MRSIHREVTHYSGPLIESLYIKMFSLFFFSWRRWWNDSWNSSLSKYVYENTSTHFHSKQMSHTFCLSGSIFWLHSRVCAHSLPHAHKHKHRKHLCSRPICTGWKINKHSFGGRWKAAGVIVGEGGGEVLIRSDPNYVGEIEPRIGRGRVGLLLQTPGYY